MGRIVVTEFVSVDGVMQAPGGEDFKYKGWTFDYERGDEGDAFKMQEVRDQSALLLGRKTYESFAGAWPKQKNEFADKLNADPKYLVSSTITEPEWENTTTLEGPVTESVAKLKDEVDGDIYIHGSRMLVQELLANDMVDQVNLMVFPVVLGVGDKLFDELPEKIEFDLKETRTVGDDGVMVQVYERR